MGLRKVLLEHALPPNWTKAKGKNGRLSYFVFFSFFFIEGNKKWFKVFFGLFILNGKFGGESPVVF